MVDSSETQNNLSENKFVNQLEWKTHPMKKRPRVAILVTLFIFIMAAMVYSITDSNIFPTLTLIVLFASLAKFYLPTKFILDDKYVIVKSTTQTIKKEWINFRSFYPDKNGVLLSPFLEPTRMENFRGLFLIFDNNQDEVTAFVKSHIASNESLPKENS
jgi:hypothetical protein